MQVATNRRGLWFVVITLSLLGLFATLSHYFFRVPVEEALANNFGPSPAWHTDQLPLYDQHSIITFLHLIPAVIFIVFAPLQLSQRLRQRFIVVHKQVGRTILALGMLMAVYGIVLGWVMPFGGSLQSIVSLIVGLGFIGSGYMGFRAIRIKNISLHRSWMSYMLAFGYTPMTMRIAIAVLTEGMGVDGQIIFAESMLASMVMNLVVVYWWLQRKPRQKDIGNNREAYDV